MCFLSFTLVHFLSDAEMLPPFCFHVLKRSCSLLPVMGQLNTWPCVNAAAAGGKVTLRPFIERWRPPKPQVVLTECNEDSRGLVSSPLHPSMEFVALYLWMNVSHPTKNALINYLPAKRRIERETEREEVCRLPCYAVGPTVEKSSFLPHSASARGWRGDE